MAAVPRALPPENERALRRLVRVRLVAATVVMGAAITILQRDGKDLAAVAMYAILGALYAGSAGAYVAFRFGASFKKLLWTLIGTDIAVLTLIAHYSGGSNSYFSILFVLPALAGGIYFEIFGGITAASLATIAWVGYNLLELGRFVVSPVETWTPVGGGIFHPLLRSYLHAAVFFAAGTVSGYISRRVLSKGHELAEREREVRSMQLSAEGIVANMSSGLIVADSSGVILSANPAARAILGPEIGAGAGKNIEELDRRLEPLVRELSLAMRSGAPRSRHEIRLVQPDGETLPLGISSSPLVDDDGSARGVIALFQDLTEVHRMRERIRRSDKMAAVGELSAAIAHEIRAPLATICGSIEMLAGELALSGEHRTLMELVMKEAGRLDNIISDFLEFARLRKPSFTPVDIKRCAEEVAMLLEHSPSFEKGSSIRIACDSDGIRICADDEQVRQVILNLGLNACEAMGEGGTLSISIGRTNERLGENDCCEECVRIDFENDGPPIPDRVRPHIFEPFYTTKSSGTGLGLAIAARIVESHGGVIEVGRSSAGKTVFSVLLPVYVTNGREQDENEEIESRALVEV